MYIFMVHNHDSKFSSFKVLRNVLIHLPFAHIIWPLTYIVNLSGAVMTTDSAPVRHTLFGPFACVVLGHCFTHLELAPLNLVLPLMFGMQATKSFSY